MLFTDNERKYIEIQNTFLKMKLLFVMEILGILENIVIENVLQYGESGSSRLQNCLKLGETLKNTFFCHFF